MALPHPECELRAFAAGVTRRLSFEMLALIRENTRPFRLAYKLMYA